MLERFTDEDLYPYSKFYLKEIKQAKGLYWVNHFSTIGIVGMSEACLNLLGADIGSEKGLKFSLSVMDFIREMIANLQEQTGDIFNLEATPAEGTSYRLAILDKNKFPEILCANEDEYRKGAAPFYTNSTQLPVNYTDDIFETLKLQDDLQAKYTGGTALHIYLEEQVSDLEAIKALIRKVVTNYRLPYFTITPTFSVCPSHGYLNGKQEKCPFCNDETEVYSRVVGYLRPIKQWNDGKQAEFSMRRTFKLS
jgi:ribonucleoside-triphosphate reductase